MMTMNAKLRSLICAVALLSAGCALNPLVRMHPGSTPEQVREFMGEPWSTTRLADGGMRWVYPTGPMGRHTYVAIFGADGKLRTFDDLLNEKGFALIRVGKTTEPEVEQLFGPPAKITPFARLRQTAWDYRFTDAWNYPAIFSVIFNEQGVVALTMQQREFYGSERGR